MEFNIAFKNLLNGDCLCRAVLRTPRAGAAVVLNNIDFADYLVLRLSHAQR